MTVGEALLPWGPLTQVLHAGNAATRLSSTAMTTAVVVAVVVIALAAYLFWLTNRHSREDKVGLLAMVGVGADGWEESKEQQH